MTLPRLPKSFYEKKKEKKKFAIGSIVRVNVPEEAQRLYGALQDAECSVASRQAWKDLGQSVPNGDFVIVKLKSAPNDKQGALRRLAAHTTGLYPVRRAWLIATGIKECQCDLRTVLMRHGCQCGGIQQLERL